MTRANFVLKDSVVSIYYMLQAWNQRREVYRVQQRLLGMMRGLLEEVRSR